MGDVIAIIIIALIVVGALIYIIKSKKSGKKCIGCPYSCSCNNKSECNCVSSEDENSTTKN